MGQFLDSLLLPFEGAPVVDLYGIHNGIGGSMKLEDTDLWFSSFELEAWRIEGQEVQTQLLVVRIVADKVEFDALCNRFRTNYIVHTRVHIIQNPHGYPLALYKEWVGPVTTDTRLNELQRQLRQPTYFNLDSFTQLTASGNWWRGSLHFKFWEGFCVPKDYGWISCEPSSEVFGLSILMPELDEIPRTIETRNLPPTPAQIAAVRYLIENQDDLCQTIFNMIFDSYAQMQEDYSVDEEYMPDISNIDDLKRLIQLEYVSIPLYERDGAGYAVFIFACLWDPEHGFSVTTHKSRILSSGSPSSAHDAIINETSDLRAPHKPTYSGSE